MAEAVDWKLAGAIARRLASAPREFDDAARRRMAADFAEFVPLSQRLVEAETGWTSAAGPAAAEVVDRADWIDANLRSFRRLLRPLLSRMEDTLSGPSAWIGPKFAAVEFAVILSWMSSKVLGQYDMLVLEDGDEALTDGQDTVYFVGPNLMSVEQRFSFEPRDFRLWVALHELTHRAQFTGVAFLRPHFLAMVEEMLGEAEPDPSKFFVALGRIAESIRLGRNPFADGVGALFATEQQKLVMDRLGGMMSLLEGHGDVVMNRAGIGHVKNAEKFASALNARREQHGAAKVVSQLLGMDAKIRQYAEGEDFIAAIEKARGPRAIDDAFRSVDHLPSLDEIRHPDRWLERVSVVTA